jgi:3-phenylpropionate/cinnamic acid dioxygenase small subunit
MSDVDDVRRLLAQYCQFLDDRRYAEWSELFAPDGVWALGGGEYHGPSEVKAYMDKLLHDRPHRRTRHLNSNILVELDGDVGRVSSDFAMLAQEPESAPWTPIAFARYTDQVARRADGQGWRFVERRLGPA